MQLLLKLVVCALMILTPLIANAQSQDTASCASFADMSEQQAIQIVGANTPFPDGRLRGVAWSPDQTKIAVGLINDEQERIQIWDLVREELVATLEVDDRFYSLADFEWSPDGSRLAASYVNSLPRIWDAELGWARLTLEVNEPIIGEVEWSPDGTQIALLGLKTIVWSAENGQLLQSFDGIGYRADVLRDGEEWYLAAQFDDVARVMNIATGEVIYELEGVTFSSLFWSVERRLLTVLPIDGTMSPVGTISIWDIDQNEKIFELDGEYIVGNVLSNGETLKAVTVGGDSEYWNIETGDRTFVFDLEPVNLYFSLNGTCQALTLFNEQFAASDIIIYDVAAGEEVTALSGHTAIVSGAEWSLDGEWLASISYDGTLRIWGSPSSES